jgi:hypothetical protein
MNMKNFVPIDTGKSEGIAACKTPGHMETIAQRTTEAGA